MIKEEIVKINLNDRKIELVVEYMNRILDRERIFEQECTKQVIKELILQNLTLNTTSKLIDEINEEPISSWNNK